MHEKELAKGKFMKMNIPALICLVVTIISGIMFIIASDDPWAPQDEITTDLIFTIVFAILTITFFTWMSGCTITVTDKRVYGTSAFRKRVDLPFDMISSVGGGIFKSISVATSSGKIKFWFVQNKSDIFNSISNCLLERQTKTGTVPNNSPSNADELKKFKELLDTGVITQEEFDAKKKELLGM